MRNHNKRIPLIFKIIIPDTQKTKDEQEQK